MKPTSTAPGVRESQGLKIQQAQASPGTARPLLTIKDLLLLAYLYPFRSAASRLSEANLYRLGGAIDPLSQFLKRKPRREAEARMALAEGLRLTNGSLQETSGRFVFNAILRSLNDLAMLDPDTRARMTPPEIQGLNHLDDALARGKGVLLTSGHFYANRLAKSHLARMGYPIVSVRNQRPNNQHLGRLGARFAFPRCLELLHQVIGEEVHVQDPECSLKIFKLLRSGRIVNVHIDAGFASQKVELPFLGQRRAFSVGLLEIVRLSGCAVLPMLCLVSQRTPSICFEEPFPLHRGASAEEFVALNLPVLVDKLERQIKEFPEQWELWARL